jgi:hypothetical protein
LKISVTWSISSCLMVALVIFNHHYHHRRSYQIPCDPDLQCPRNQGLPDCELPRVISTGALIVNPTLPNTAAAQAGQWSPGSLFRTGLLKL